MHGAYKLVRYHNCFVLCSTLLLIPSRQVFHLQFIESIKLYFKSRASQTSSFPIMFYRICTRNSKGSGFYFRSERKPRTVENECVKFRLAAKRQSLDVMSVHRCHFQNNLIIFLWITDTSYFHCWSEPSIVSSRPERKKKRVFCAKSRGSEWTHFYNDLGKPPLDFLQFGGFDKWRSQLSGICTQVTPGILQHLHSSQ